MTSWFEALPAFVAALLMLALPGGAVLLALRVRGLMALCLAPAVSVSVIAVSAVVAPLIHLPWNVAVVLLGTAIAAGAGWAARRFIPALRAAGPEGEAKSRVGAGRSSRGSPDCPGHDDRDSDAGCRQPGTVHAGL